ncbi:HlyD family type I secretion periplasmic adaptor subunit [Pseudooceanicola nanhaiensis]|uniref:HlyD family type I secretion periplasmic adaptor subunit n=1 Tax=Pseudooceanicola nanhaiensis TaxID=375761 RepID=UPI001CD72846|nr:HlyD family type I secretion periplasmic adaptor subunit [Pseudooceanicola nanhaiensis]MCA0920205.1 HlyD family type I secretion periplasmic adaptor subunit [Pseudooceanicola nanhaiensis]
MGQDAKQDAAKDTETGGFPILRVALVGTLAVGVLVFGLGAWAVGTNIDGAVLAPGRVIVDRNRQAVQHLDGGIVADVLIKEGDRVEAGDVLIRLDPRLVQSELAVTESQLYEIMARRGRLEAERDDAQGVSFDPVLLEVAATRPEVAALVGGQERLFEARMDNLRQSIVQYEAQRSQLEKQITGIDAQRESITEQLELTKSETEVQQGLLDRGLAQGSRVLNLRREGARLTGMMGQAIAQRAQAEERIAEIRIEILRSRSQLREDAITTLRDMNVSEVQTHQRRETLLTQLERMEIRAPVSGVVYGLAVNGPQSVIRPAQPLLFIVPQDRPLVIEAEVNPINISDVHLDQDVILRLRAVDQRMMPDLHGRVTRLSPDAFTDEQSRRSYYRAEIELPKAELAKLPAHQLVLPGLPVDAFIRTGLHSPLAYLTAPLTQYFDTAMR